MNKKIIIVIMIVLFTNLVYAKCPSDCPEGFNLESGDYSLIDNWRGVKMSDIPLNRIKDVPPDKLGYNELDIQQRLQMTPNQIAENFNNIEDLTRDVDKSKAEIAIKQKYSVNVDLGKGAAFKNGVLRATYEQKGHVSLSGGNYKDGILIIDKDGIIKFIPNKDKKTVKIPKTDSVAVDTQGRDIILETPSGAETPLNGVVICKDRVCFKPPDKEATIGKTKFLKTDKPVYLYLNDPNFNPEDHEKENYYHTNDGEESIHSAESGEDGAEGGRVPVRFLPGHKLLDVCEKCLLRVSVENGDGIVIKQIIVKEDDGKTIKKGDILHKSSENGVTKVTNDGLIYEFNKDKIEIFPVRKLSYKDLKSGEIQPVSLQMRSDSIKILNKLAVDSSAKLSLISNDGEERVVFEKQGYPKQLLDMKQEEIDKLIEDVNKASGEYPLSALRALPAALQAGLTPEQTVDVIKKTIEASGIYSGSALRYALPAALHAASKAGLTPEQTVDVIKKITESSGKYPYMALQYSLPAALEAGLTPEQTVDVIKNTIKASGEYSSNALKSALPAALQAGLNPDQTVDIIKKTIKASGKYSHHALESALPAALKEYNGNNLNEIVQGATTVTKYIRKNTMTLNDAAKNLEFRYTNVKDKQSLAEELARSINSYYESNEIPSQYTASKFAVLINTLHDNEGSIDRTDTIREQITKSSTFKAKYHLIAEANADLYQSTFDKLFSSFPQDKVGELRRVDPNGNYWTDFIIQIGERDRLNELLSQDPNFFREAVDKGISSSPKLEKNTVSLANTFVDFYSKPEYSGEKEYFEGRLVELYKSADSQGEQASYAYLIKLSENPANEEFRKLHSTLPELPAVNVPQCSGDVCTGKQYFYIDENWYDITLKAYTKPGGIYQFGVVEQTDTTTVLEKKVSGKTMRMVLTTDNSDASDVLNDDETILVVHRGHSYNSKKTFEGRSNKEKIIIDGGCGGPGRVLEIQKQYPNAQVVYDKNTAEGVVNQYEAYKILRRVTLGQTDWDNVRDKTEIERGIVLPNDKNQLFLTYKKRLLRTPP